MFALALLFIMQYRSKKNNKNEAYNLPIKSSDENKTSNWQLRRDRVYKRNARRENKNKTWAFISYIKSVLSICESYNFYDLDKSISEFNESLERLHDETYTPTKNNKDLAIRFCRISFYSGKCTQNIQSIKLDKLLDYESFDVLDVVDILKVSTDFKNYWDNVLESYKRKKSKIDRINYVINHLKEMRERGNLKNIPRFTEQIDNLLSYYISALENIS